ncbi:MAG: NAD(P)/FAD-dependent oxidoreductase [Fimbriimonadaceae bacterium]|nr:NAD(P)/FAD-dependent oxidoreductase [Chthonomonadaceae bacterium]MCO5295365.1 NAD(P)/FAD-dependent oxidoreductase [Fimbriimonadaceae bacterium]
MGDSRKVVIVGAGFGGLTLAKALCGEAFEVTVVDRTNHHLFQPLLYQVATAGLSPASIAAPIRSILRRCKNTRVLMAEVVDVDVPGRRVLLADGSHLPYDSLVLATGASHSYFGHPEWERDAPGLKTVEDATEMRRRILTAFERAERCEDPAQREALLTFAIVGGGPTGVELAGSIGELAKRVLARDFRRIDPTRAKILLLEGGDRILATFSKDLAERAVRDLRRLGVEVRTSTRVEKVTPEGVETTQGPVAAATVLWAAGVEASPAARWLCVEPDRAGRVPVGPTLEPAADTDLFVIGDTARCEGEDGVPLPGVAPVAMQQARHVAKLLRSRAGLGRDPGPFHYVDKGNLATVGRSSAVLEWGRWKLGGALAWLLWLAIHIVYLIGFRNRIVVLVEWAWAYATYERGARLITRPGQ